MLRAIVAVVALCIVSALCGPQTLTPVPLPNGILPKLKINASYVTGVSSGAYMAGQLHVAYASHFSGAALFAGGPYYCAKGDVDIGLYTCAESLPITNIDLPLLESLSSNWSASGLNDDISHLQGQPVWVHHGLVDFTVWARVTDALVSYYQHFGSNVVYHNTTITNHAWISPYGPVECDLFESPYIANCGFDAEEIFLSVLFGSVNAPAETLTGTLYSFSQDYYVNKTWSPTYTEASGIDMDTNGFLYVPAACAKGAKCRLVSVFHGCQMGYYAINLDLVNYANMNQYADTNNFVVLYPQAIATDELGPNPEGTSRCDPDCLRSFRT